MTELLRDQKPNAKWALWRQDDNGNKFHIKDFENESEADSKALEFEARGHKQTYWVEKIKS